jgi:hypothetical protein
LVQNIIHDPDKRTRTYVIIENHGGNIFAACQRAFRGRYAQRPWPTFGIFPIVLS